MKIKNKSFVVLFCLAFIVLAISAYQFAASGGGGWTFSCYGANCQTCSCMGDYAETTGPCCGICVNNILYDLGIGDQQLLRCCEIECPNN